MSVPSTSVLRVQIYEDNDELRSMLSMMLSHSPGFELCGAYSNCSQVLENIEREIPDVVLCDIDMPEVNGIEGVKRIRSQDKDLLVLMYTVFADDEHLFEALREGANGYLLKGDSPAVILAAIREVYNGGAPMSPEIAKKVLDFFANQNRKSESNLSLREKEILSLLVKGNSAKMIAAQTDITFQTVKTHLKRIYDKLHVHSQTEAVSKAIKDRLV